MAGYLDFRDNANAPITCVGDQLGNLGLGVVVAVRAHLLKFGVFLAFDSEPLIVREVKVQHIELHGGHGIKVALQNVLGHPMAGHVNDQATPGEPRVVLDLHARRTESLRIESDELQKGLDSSQHAHRRGCRDASLSRPNFELVGFIFFDGLDLLPRVIAVEHERRFAGIRLEPVA